MTKITTHKQHKFINNHSEMLSLLLESLHPCLTKSRLW